MITDSPAHKLSETPRYLLLLAGALVLISFLAYSPALRAGFVFDDGSLLLNNPLIRAKDGLYRFWFTNESPDYYPLTWSLLWAEWRLWGLHPLGYHVVNILFHALGAVGVWLVLRRLNIRGAWLAAAVFAIHPVNVATVAWVIEQKSTLAMLFYTLSIFLYLSFDKHGKRYLWTLSLLALFLGLLSKSAIVMLPLVLLGCLWWRHGRLRPKDLLHTSPFFAVSLILGLVTLWFQAHRALHDNVVSQEGFFSRLITAGWVPWFYLSKALWPVNLVVIYPKWQMNPSNWTAWLPGIMLLACFALFSWKRGSWGRALLFGLGYFVATLFPVMGFFDQGFYHYSPVADHWQYFSIVGIIALVVGTADEWYRRAPESARPTLQLAGVAVLVILAGLSWQRSTVYANNETLWQDNVEKYPKVWAAHDNLGVALAKEGKAPEAVAQFEQALWNDPNEANVHDNLATTLAGEGHIEEAVQQYESALRLRPDFVEAHGNLGALLAAQGKINEAIAHYQAALRLQPDHAETCNNFAWLLATQMKPTAAGAAQAVQLATRAVRLTDGQQPGYWDTLAAAYAASGRFPDAVATAQRAAESAQAAGQMKLANEIEARARLYRDGKPYRE